MSQMKQMKLLAAFAAVSLIANSVIGQNEVPQLPRQPDAQPAVQAPREGQPPRAATVQRGEAQPGDPRTDWQGSSAELDRHLATWLAAENEVQVMLSQQVAENAENEEVKQFAQQMVEHHQQITQRLREVVQSGESEQPSRRVPTGQGQPNQDRPRSELPGQDQSRAELPDQQEPFSGLPVEEGPFPEAPGRDQPRPEVAGQAQARADQTAPRQTPPQQPGQPQREISAQPGEQPESRDQSAGGDLNPERDGNAMIAWQLTSIRQKVCQENLKSAMEELQNKEGAEVDKFYMQLQVFTHHGMVNTIEIFQHYASDELQSVLEEARPKVKAHLEEAKQLAEKIDSNGAEGE